MILEKNKLTIIIAGAVLAVILVAALLIILTNNKKQSETLKPTSAQVEEDGGGGQDEDAKTDSSQAENNANPDTSQQTSRHDNDRDAPETPGDNQDITGEKTENIKLPSRWADLSSAEKTNLNPYNCELDKQYVRADNGHCTNIHKSAEKLLLNYTSANSYDADSDIVYEVEISATEAAAGLLQCQTVSAESLLGQGSLALIESQKTDFDRYLKMIVSEIDRGSYSQNNASIPENHRHIAEKLVLFYEYLNAFDDPSARQAAIGLDRLLQLLNNSQECSFNLKVVNRGAELWYLNGCDGFELNDIKINSRSQSVTTFASHTISPTSLKDYLQYSELPVDAVACTQALWSIPTNETVYNKSVYLLVAQDVIITHIEFTQDKPQKTYSIPLQDN